MPLSIDTVSTDSDVTVGGNVNITGNIVKGGNTISLPSTNDTIVLRASVDTLTNKSIDASLNTLTNIPESAVTNLVTDLSNKQPLNSQLTTLSGYNSNGLFTQVSAGTYTGRTITAGSTKISISNGNGVAANPTIDVTEANLTISNMGGTLAETHGGTNQTTYTTGDILYASATNTLSKLAGVATGNVLISGGVSTAPSWGQVTDAHIATHTSTKISITTKGQLNSAIVYNDQANTFGAFNQTFKAANMLIVDATTSTKVMTFNTAGQTAATTLTLATLSSTSQTLQFPNITTTDTLVTLGLAQTITGAKTFSSSSILMNNPGDTFAYTIAASAITAARTLTLPLITQAETVAVQPQILDFQPTNPTSTTSTTGVMMGLAGSITPRVTGRLFITVSGQCVNSSNNRSCVITVRTGTGTAPANGAALTGTVQSPAVTSHGASTTTFPFCIPTIATGFTVGTAVWIDISLANVTSGTASVSNITITAIEI